MATPVRVSHVRIPPRKARLVVDLIRGKGTNEATAILRHTTHKSSKVIEKLLKSAISNAVTQEKADADRLYIKEAFVDPGPIIKRFTARAQGRGTRVMKRTSHITLKLEVR
ncbi:MAG: 50S ribosomal protein L22 [Pseudomonadota bacterium]